MFNFKKKKSGKSRKEIKRIEREEYEKRVMNYNNVVAIELSNRSRPKIAPKDTFISIQSVNKIYDNLVQAVYNFDLDIKKNEFIVFVGPSGCGKSTILRMIAGLEEITSGNLFIDGKYANSLPPKDRDIAMVFQSYALYPHMSVYDNMAFSLKIKESLTPVLDENGNQKIGVNEEKVQSLEKEIAEINNKIEGLKLDETKAKVEEARAKSESNPSAKEEFYKARDFEYGKLVQKEELDSKLNSLNEELSKVKNTQVPLFETKKLTQEEIDERINDAAKILQIEEYLDRKPKALSGGQRQRVALGRAICKRAKLFLMDEPLSNLDAKLRVSMRSEIIRIHKAIGATSIYVTHDQTEAMTMADRIVIMNKGVIQQIGTPREIYNHPKNVFVATFIGSPSMNILDATIADNKIVFDENNTLILPDTTVNDLACKIKQKVDKIEDFIEHGKQEEYDKQITVKIEEFKLNQAKKGYKYTHDENGNVIDPIKNMKLDDSEIEICDRIYNEKLEKAIKRKEIYEEMLKTNSFKVKFGVRPENIFIEGTSIDEKIRKSNSLKFQISIPELLGNEYFLHTTLGEKDFIFKTNANNDVKENDIVNVFFDLDKIHIFDPVDTNILL